METRITIEVDKKEFRRLHDLMFDANGKKFAIVDLEEMGFLDIKGINGKITIGITCEEKEII